MNLLCVRKNMVHQINLYNKILDLMLIVKMLIKFVILIDIMLRIEDIHNL